MANRGPNTNGSQFFMCGRRERGGVGHQWLRWRFSHPQNHGADAAFGWVGVGVERK